jgi:hypothetical protein
MPDGASTRAALYKTDILEKVLKANASSEVVLPPTRRITRRTIHRMITEIPLRVALNTTEILENVLSFLTPFSLFSLQRVCRQWRDLIASSPSIQETMFLRARDRLSEVWMSEKPLLPPFFQKERFSDFLNQKFRVVSATEIESGAWKSSFGGAQHLFTLVTLNPLLSRARDIDYGLVDGI